MNFLFELLIGCGLVAFAAMFAFLTACFVALIYCLFQGIKDL